MMYQGNAQQGRCISTGRFDFEIRERGKLVRRGSFPNGMTTVGLTYHAGVALGATTQITTWYMGLILNSGTPALALADTMASHAGWSETSSTYAEAARPALTFSAASGGVIATSAPVTFTANTSVSLYGAFINSVTTKGGTLGTLWATGAFTSVQALTNGQTINVNYSHTDTSA